MDHLTYARTQMGLSLAEALQKFTLLSIGDGLVSQVPALILSVGVGMTAGDINPVHMGVVLIATLAFGLITPPYGLVLLMASKFIGVRFSQALRAAYQVEFR